MELSRLQQLALANKLNPEDITGGTITLSNIGAIGGKFGAPILNLPEVAIVAIGRIQKVLCFADDGNAYPASVMMVNSVSVTSCSFFFICLRAILRANIIFQMTLGYTPLYLYAHYFGNKLL
jgi:hypothetical protein